MKYRLEGIAAEKIKNGESMRIGRKSEVVLAVAILLAAYTAIWKRR